MTIAVLVHAIESLLEESGATLAGRAAFRAGTIWTGTTFRAGTIWTRFAIGARTVRTGSTFRAAFALRRTTEATVGTPFRATATFRAAESTFTAHGTAHALGDFASFGFIEEAVAIGVDAGKSLLQFLRAGFDEFGFADFAIAIGVSAFEHFTGVASFRPARAKGRTGTVAALLGEGGGGGDKRASEEDA